MVQASSISGGTPAPGSMADSTQAPVQACMQACVPRALSVSVPGAPLSLEVYQADSRSFHVASTLVLGERDAVLIDAQFTLADAHRLVANIVASGRRLTTVYISHGDPDYYFGLDVVRQAFPQAQVLATEETVAYIRRTGTAKISFWGAELGRNGTTNVVLPQPLSQPFIELEGQRLEIAGWGGPLPTHTVVWIPALRAVVGGVLVYADAHGFMADVQTTAERDDWLAALDRIDALQPEWVIPSHAGPGAPVDRRAVQFARNYIRAFEEELPQARDGDALIAAMKRRFPRATLDLPLEIGARVLKGEMPW